MFAVVKTGGKQYKVAKGDIIRVEKLDGEAGDKIELNEVLAFSKDGKALDIGAPLVKGAKATAEIKEQTRNDKIVVFKKKRRQNYRRKKGHKQHVTVLEITDIKAA